MCGITGLFALRATAAPRLSYVSASNARLVFRGPDSGAEFVDDKIALGHRRLSIIDTSSCGAQPMQDVSGRYVIAFNGEIFNFAQLSEQHLSAVWERIGGPRSHSDTPRR